MLRRLEFLREAQWWPFALLEGWRNESLSRLAKTIYEEVPFYRELFFAAGIHWTTIEEPRDLRRLPVVTKEMLRTADPGSVVRETGFPTHEEISSGSTGAPFRVIEDSRTADMHRASFLLALEWAGWNLGEPHVQTGVITDRGVERRAKDILLRCHYVPVHGLDNAKLDRVLETISRRRIRHLWGYPSALYHLALRAREVAWNGDPLASIVTWADQLHYHHRREIEQVFGQQIHDSYGCSEGIQIAAQCGSGSHYHVHMLDAIVEYLDGDDEPVAAGEPGRIVVTRLHPGTMPLVRYDTGDIGVAGEREACSCGRAWETMESVAGRITDIVISPRGRRYLAHSFAVDMESFADVREYQIEQTAGDEIVIRVVAAENHAALPLAIRDRLRESGLDDMMIRVELVERIAPTEVGKRRWVIGLGAEGAGAMVRGN
ncbi:MAG: hypothetical protein R2729_09895 [Bryobacteraceae bacterium]